MEQRKRIQIEYTLKERYQIPRAELDGNLHQCFVTNDTHYLLTDQGRVYLGQPSNGRLAVEPLKIAELKNVTIKCIASNDQGEIYFLDKENLVYCLKNGTVAKSGYVVNSDAISNFYVVKMETNPKDATGSSQKRYLFFFVAERPSYCWYEELDLFDLPENDSPIPANKYFFRRNLFGLLGNDILVHSSHREHFVMFLTRNYSRSRTCAVIVDVITEKVTHCVSIPEFDVLKGKLICGDSFIFLTKHNELLCMYHLNEMINDFLKKNENILDQETAGKWKSWREDKGFSTASGVKEAYRYAKGLKLFIEMNNLTKRYMPLLRGIDFVLAGNQSYGYNCKNMLELHPDFRDTKACDIYYFDDFLYVIAMNGFVYKLSISFEDFSS